MCSKHLFKLVSISINFISILAFQVIVFTQTQTTRVIIDDSIQFTFINLETLMADLDNLAANIQSAPNNLAYIVVYRRLKDLPGTNFQYFNRAKYYLVEDRGINAKRLIFINGGIRSEISYECWILPSNSAPPKPSSKIPEPDIGESQTYKFDSHDYITSNGCAYSIGCLEGKYYFAQLDEFAQIVKGRSNVKAYLIIYAGYEWPGDDSSKVTSRMLRKEKYYLIRKHGIESSRIVLAYGGYRRVRSVDLWILPPNGKKPKPTPDIFSPARKKKLND